MAIPALSDVEKAILAPPLRLTIRQWAERRLRITEGPMVGGQGVSTAWHAETFPPQTTIMDAIGDRRWRRVWLMTGPQTFGKTESACLPALLHAIGHRRVSALYVASRLPLALTQWRKKILPAMLADDGLAALISEDRDLIGDKNERRFLNGTSLHFSGGESVGAISGFTVAVVICDDIQAYPGLLPGFGHPADVAFARAAAYPEEQRTLVGCGTAGTVDDYLWRSLAASTLYCLAVPCLGCGIYQLLEWERMIYPEDPDKALTQTWMRCAGGCDHRIDFDELPRMLARHRWVSCPPGEDWVNKPSDGGTALDIGAASIYPDSQRATQEAGFWCNALAWPLGETWGQRAAEWLSIRGDPDKVKDHQQRVLARPWREPDPDENALTVEALAEHVVATHKYRSVPDQADLVTMTADVHDRYLYYIVRAWRRQDGTSWLVDAGTIGVHGPKKGETLTADEQRARIGHAIRLALEDLWEMDNQGWVKVGGEIVRSVKALVDGGYRPDAVGQFCRARNTGLPERKWEMVEGSRSSTPQPIWPRQVRRNQRGHVWREIGTSEAKHLLRERLAIPRDKPGYMHVYADHPLDSYYRHMVSEHWVEKKTPTGTRMIWERRPGAGPNHWWDCEVYQIAAAIACGVRLMVGEEPAAEQARAKTSWFALRKRK